MTRIDIVNQLERKVKMLEDEVEYLKEKIRKLERELGREVTE